MQKSSILQESWTELLSEVRSEKQQTLYKTLLFQLGFEKKRWRWNSSRIAIEQNFVHILWSSAFSSEILLTFFKNSAVGYFSVQNPAHIPGESWKSRVFFNIDLGCKQNLLWFELDLYCNLNHKQLSCPVEVS